MNALQQKIDLLGAAISRGDLIDQNLNVVQRGSCRWRIYVLLTCLLRPFYYLIGKDPFGAFRIGNVTKAMLTFCQNHKADFSPDLKAKICAQVLNPLEGKANGKYSNQVRAAIHSLNQLNAAQAVAPVSQRNEVVEKAIGNFAHQLHLTLSQQSTKSICSSPFSITFVLGMILMGLDGDRKRWFLQALGLDDLSEEIVHSAIRGLMDHVCSGNGNLYEITTAQALAHPVQGELIYDSYKRNISQFYLAEMFGIGRNPAEICRAINEWVATKTRGQITNLVSPGDIPPDLPFALLNGTYFKGKWERNFNPAFDDTFLLGDGQEIQIKMMSLTGRFKVYDGDTFRTLMIPYQSSEGHELYFIVFFPNRGRGLGQLEMRLTPELIETTRQDAKEGRYAVKLPKMNLDLRLHNLYETLMEMGLPLDAPLDRLGVQATITKIIHQAKMKVDEQGTEATAATVAIGRCMAAPPNMEDLPKEFFVDRSFAFALMDGPTVLFQGNVRTADALVSA